MSSSDHNRNRDLASSRAPAAAATPDDDARQALSTLDRLAGDSATSPEIVRAVVSAATRLYAEASARAGRELPPLDPAISTTEALTLACALVRSQDLTPFEMAVWFSRGQQMK